MKTETLQFVVAPFETPQYVVVPEDPFIKLANRKRAECLAHFGKNSDKESLRDNEISFHRARVLFDGPTREVQEQIYDDLEAVIVERLKLFFKPHFYRIENGKLYPKNGDRSIAEIIQTGTTARSSIESNKDKIREQKELEAWVEKIDTVLGNENAPVGTRFLLLSPPGPKGSSYGLRYINELEKVELPNGEKTVKFQPNLVNLDYSGYLQFANSIDPTFEPLFTKSGIQFDAFCVNSPLETQIPIPKNLIQKFSEQDTKLIITLCRQYLFPRYWETLILKRDAWKELDNCSKFILNGADEIFEGVINGQLKNRQSFSDLLPRFNFARLSQMPVRGIASGCGFSGNINQESNPLLQNSVAQFGIENQQETWEYHPGQCANPECPDREKFDENPDYKVDVGPCEICKECERTLPK